MIELFLRTLILYIAEWDVKRISGGIWGIGMDGKAAGAILACPFHLGNLAEAGVPAVAQPVADEVEG